MYQVELQCKGHEFTVKEVINKMKTLRQKYKMEKDKSRRNGNGTAKKNAGSIFIKIDSIMSQKHIINPPSIIDTMTDISHKTLMDDMTLW